MFRSIWKDYRGDISPAVGLMRKPYIEEEGFCRQS